ncbi:MAG: AMP-binding protein, partial [Phycisphaerae bacterium]|nr:AMP-binding protein [Phycisphaerae bacterium]
MENKEQLTLYHFLTEAVAKYADRPVARTRAGGTEWREYTYSQWNTWIQELAMGFVEIGVAPGDKIVHIADNRMEWMVITMAI